MGRLQEGETAMQGAGGDSIVAVSKKRCLFLLELLIRELIHVGNKNEAGLSIS